MPGGVSEIRSPLLFTRFQSMRWWTVRPVKPDLNKPVSRLTLP